MPERSSKNEGSRDVNVIATSITEQTIGESRPIPPESFKVTSGKNPVAVILGKLGGKKGGRARADKLTAEGRREIARNAAQVRWRKSGR